MDRLSLADVADGAAALALDERGSPVVAAVVVDLDTPGPIEAAVRALAEPSVVTIGVSRREAPDPDLVAALTCTVVPGSPTAHAPIACVPVDDPDRRADELAAAAQANPTAALALADQLRMTVQLPVADGLRCESFVYSMLLAGPEFAAWRAGRTTRDVEPDDADPVLLKRSGDRLEIILNRPRRHNAYSHGLRDGLVDALTVAALDDSITEVRLSGAGPSFCSGGDLDEFGTTPDVVAAHLIRTRRSAAAAIHRCTGITQVTLHGACTGAGIELAAFAGRVHARAGTRIQLPELAMGLVPGAGGTVSLPRRIGRWRTAFLALSGTPIDLPTALAWGLVDAEV